MREQLLARAYGMSSAEWARMSHPEAVLSGPRATRRGSGDIAREDAEEREKPRVARERGFELPGGAELEETEPRYIPDSSRKTQAR